MRGVALPAVVITKAIAFGAALRPALNQTFSAALGPAQFKSFLHHFGAEFSRLRAVRSRIQSAIAMMTCLICKMSQEAKPAAAKLAPMPSRIFSARMFRRVDGRVSGWRVGVGSAVRRGLRGVALPAVVIAEVVAFSAALN